MRIFLDVINKMAFKRYSMKNSHQFLPFIFKILGYHIESGWF